MSVLETPRLVFRGRITWDPIVTNNNIAQYDEDKSETVFPPDPSQLVTSPPGSDQVAAFRRDAIEAVKSGNNWNPDGTHRSIFFDTKVVGVDIGHGLSTDDPIVGLPVNLTGMLVDLEPYGSISSQLFFDKMTFGFDGGCQIRAKRQTRMTARYINFNRYQPVDGSAPLAIAGVASVVWQTSFLTKDLKIGAHESPVLSHFLDHLALPDVLGLTVKWTAYRTAYFDTLTGNAGLDDKVYGKLYDKLLLGGFQPNPARSVLVGVLGLWRKGEPMSESGDRALLCGPPPPPPPTSSMKTLLSSAHFRASGDTLTIDLSNSVPEVDTKGTKIDLGDIVVTGQSGDPKIVADIMIGRIPYDQYCCEAYEANAGLVTLHVPGVEGLIKNLTLQATCPDNRYTTKGPSSLREATFRAIPGQPIPDPKPHSKLTFLGSPNLYIDEFDKQELRIQVLLRGVPAGAGVDVYVAQTSNGGYIDLNADGKIALYTPTPLKTDADGIATLTFTGGSGAVNGYVFMDEALLNQLNTEIVDKQVSLDTQRTPYAMVRSLPADLSIAQMAPTYGNVYRYVLRNWNAMAPCMDNWLRLDDERQVKSFKPVLKHVTDEANFESFLYMPVTRDLTRGSRTLLYRYLDSPSAPVAAAADVAEERLDLVGLSRSLRQG